MTEAEDLHARLAAAEAELAKIKGTPGAISPLAPAEPTVARPVDGVTLATAATGIRYKGRDDVLLLRIARGSTIAGVFTRSNTRSAPVLWCERALAALRETPPAGPFGIVVNAGNANAFTGAAGEASTAALAESAALALDTSPDCVMIASTGVIGERLPHDRITSVLGTLTDNLSSDPWLAAAKAIMTTDTFPKLATARAKIDGETVTISGFIKGSGMIAPDMATMLGFVFTDARIGWEALQALLSEVNEKTFNAITVDGDTSTSDTVLLAATAKATHDPVTDPRDHRLSGFRAALGAVMEDLAHQVVRDGEGATKFIEIAVKGAEDEHAAKRIGLAIANSPLVKTAFAGEDPNWGRIVMAIGKSGERADRDALTIHFGDVLVAEKGWVAQSYREEDGAAYMKGSDLKVTVDVGIGDGDARVWTCDLTYAYIRINADYRS